MKRESYFDGGIFGLLGINILTLILTVVTLGIATPWAAVIRLRWINNHTVIEGRRLGFDGSGSSLFGHWILWLLLTIITFGIYSFWLTIKMKQWEVEHTYFLD